MKKIILILSILALSFATAPVANAIKASRQVIKYTQPDGSTINIVLHGDEFHHWATTENGRPLTLGKDKFYREAPNAPIMSMQAIQRRQQAARSQEEIQKTTLSEGSHKFLVILIAFKDLDFTVDDPNTAFYNLLNQEGYSKNGGTGSAKDYYTENSSGQFNPEFDVYGPVTLSKNYAYYGGNDQWGDDSHPDEALNEACHLLDDEVDFSQYDQDGDGYVDNVFYYYAGHNEAEGASSNTIWPHQWSLYYYNCYCDGVRIYRYACTSEYKGYSGKNMCGIGTFCHEFGHVIGLPDFYDTDYNDNGYCDPLSNFSLMDSGSYNNSGRTPPYMSSMERYILGWMGKATLIESRGRFTVPPVREQQSYYVRTGNNGETFLMETRDGTSWDKYIDKGLLIYHIDHSSNNVHGSTARSRWDNWNGINCYSDHPCYFIEWAKGNYAPFPGSGSTTVTQFLGTAYNGTEAEYALYDISFDGVNSYFNTKPGLARIVSGVVYDYWGIPVEGAKVSAVAEDGTDLGTVTTGSNGAYDFDITDVECDNFTLVASADGYTSRNSNVTVTAGTFTRNFHLSSEKWQPLILEYNKFGSFGGATGLGSLKSVMGAIRYTATEMAGKSRHTINEVSFMLAESSASKVEIIVEAGSERIFTKEVTNPVLNGWNTVDLSSYGVMIPEAKDIYVGVAVSYPKTGYPLAIDAGPAVNGGGFMAEYTTGKGSWQKIDEGNLLLDFTIAGPANPLRKEGFSYIGRDEDGEPILLPGKGLTPKTVDIKQNGESITAVVEYTNGSKETLTLEL